MQRARLLLRTGPGLRGIARSNIAVASLAGTQECGRARKYGYFVSAACCMTYDGPDSNDLIPAPQEKLEWVTPKISLMESDATEGLGKITKGVEGASALTCFNKPSDYQCGASSLFCHKHCPHRQKHHQKP